MSAGGGGSSWCYCDFTGRVASGAAVTIELGICRAPRALGDESVADTGHDEREVEATSSAAI